MTENTSPETTHGSAFDESYFYNCCGLPYERSAHWIAFFRKIAQSIVRDLASTQVLDVGCAIGLLVEALNEHGVIAKGFDISDYAIEHAVETAKPYIYKDSILNPDAFNERVDLVVCIEVVEHLKPGEAEQAIKNLCRWSDQVLFRSTPDHYDEATHFNVQQPGYWAEQFARHNYFRVLDYDASYIAPWAMLFRKQTPLWPVVVKQYEDKIWRHRKESYDLRTILQNIQSANFQYQEQLNAKMAEIQRVSEQYNRAQAETQRVSEQYNRAQAETRTVLIQTQHVANLLQLQLDSVTAELEQNRSRINLMTSTRGWHTLERWWRFKMRLLPSGSSRLHLYQLIRTSLYIFFTQGPFIFVRRLVSWLRGERQTVIESVSRFYQQYKFIDSAYEQYAIRFEPSVVELDQQRADAALLKDDVAIHVVTPVFNPPLDILRETVRSIRTQTYPHWQWHLVDAGTDDAVWKYLRKMAKQDARIKISRKAVNEGISENTNVALRQIKDGYIVMLDHDDTLAPNALYEVAQAIRQHPDADFIYSDADKLDEKGLRCEPLFKPDWSPEMLICVNILNQISVYKATLLDQVGYLNPLMDGAHDWDLYFRISEKASYIHHIPKVLYHWRKSPTSTAQNFENKSSIRDVQQQAISAHLERQGLADVEVRFDLNHPVHKFFPLSVWKQKRTRRISIIIPTKDASTLLDQCLTSLYRLTNYPDYEVILVDTGSVELATQTLYQRYQNQPNLKVVNYTEAFNFSRACNFGKQHADGDLFLFLNNDTEIINSDWLTVMAQWFELPGIGIVGAKLLYPNRTIQHAGVFGGMGGLASHLFVGEPENIWTMFGTDVWYRTLSAVTGACLLISREAFEAVNGFDEKFLLNYSDVELCLEVRKKGYRVVYTPHARLIHHEGSTHGKRIPRRDFERADLLWQSWLTNEDPYFNRNLSCQTSSPMFRFDAQQDTPSTLNRRLMARLPYKEFIQLPDDLQ